jgi:hypothetical protein
MVTYVKIETFLAVKESEFQLIQLIKSFIVRIKIWIRIKNCNWLFQNCELA